MVLTAILSLSPPVTATHSAEGRQASLQLLLLFLGGLEVQSVLQIHTEHGGLGTSPPWQVRGAD